MLGGRGLTGDSVRLDPFPNGKPQCEQYGRGSDGHAEAVSPDELPRAVGGGWRTGQNRLVFEMPANVGGQLVR